MLTLQDKDSRYQISECGQYYEIRPELLPMYMFSLMMQTSEWLYGTPMHNTYWDECCPDFSCCGHEPWPYDLRVSFLLADDRTQLDMMFSILQQTIDENGIDLNKVYLVGQQPKSRLQ